MKTCLWGFRLGQTQTGLYNRMLEILYFGRIGIVLSLFLHKKKAAYLMTLSSASYGSNVQRPCQFVQIVGWPQQIYSSNTWDLQGFFC